jgi:putative Ca2+/H+ antiporter (TMEM165/GDT1 family)
VLLAVRRRPLPVFVGAAAAFVVQCFIAVAFGGVLSLLPARAVRAGAGLLFLGFAWVMWNREEEELPAVGASDHDTGFLRSAAAAFGVIFVAEWGDLTQLATATLAARHGRPFTVFLASTAALWCVAALAVAVGRRLQASFDPRPLERFAAVLFALVGFFFLLRP